MRLGTRPKRKQDQALDLVASAAKTWSEWHLAKRASTGVKKGAKKAAALRSGKSSARLRNAVTGTPAKITGAVAVAGGLGAVALRKLRRGSETVYTPPAPHEPGAPPPPPPVVGYQPPPLAAAPPPPEAPAEEPVAAEPEAAEPVAAEPEAEPTTDAEPAAEAEVAVAATPEEPEAEASADDASAEDAPADADETPAEDDKTPAEDAADRDQ